MPAGGRLLEYGRLRVLDFQLLWLLASGVQGLRSGAAVSDGEERFQRVAVAVDRRQRANGTLAGELWRNDSSSIAARRVMAGQS